MKVCLLADNKEQRGINPITCEVGKMAFLACVKLKKIYIPETVTKIDDYAFMGCVELGNSNVKKLKIPDNVTDIGNYAFFGCTKLDKLTIPNNVTGIGDYAFYGCSSLKRLTIPENLKPGKCTFVGCTIEELYGVAQGREMIQ